MTISPNLRSISNHKIIDAMHHDASASIINNLWISLLRRDSNSKFTIISKLPPPTGWIGCNCFHPLGVLSQTSSHLHARGRVS